MLVDNNYKQWIKEIKTYIRSQQIKAAVKVNTELLKVYWRLGSDIVAHKADAQWGSKFYESLSIELKAEFPDMKGFSITNLKYCKRFYELYVLLWINLLYPSGRNGRAVIDADYFVLFGCNLLGGDALNAAFEQFRGQVVVGYDD